jgi:hypothetical protein
MAIKIYAAGTAETLDSHELPSPTQLQMTKEQIWSENTGRDVSSNATMTGRFVATKYTANIAWGMMTYNDLQTIQNQLSTGFFWFKAVIGSETHSFEAYRGNIAYEVAGMAGGQVWYKNVQVDVIER